ncbi:MAG: GAF domain-containing protein [Lyngbya sp. HA4199-MV5]|jgi:signal transduction histidine kinase|nr:GAF domain-containing protein [Lyngbya sp. HA4199-MV5]
MAFQGLSSMECSPMPPSRINDCSLVEMEAYRLNQRLHHLIKVIQQLTVARDLDSIMAAVRTGARQLTGADGATFVLRDGDQCHYADEDAITPLWKGGRFPMSACISGWVMLNQQPVVIEDIYADSRIPIDAYRPTFVKSLAMVPIRTRNPVGAIGNYWATRHTPTQDEINLLQTLADAAAVALENVHLYEEQEHQIQQRTAQLQRALDFEALLKRITDNVRDSLDEHQILATVVQELTQGLVSSRCSTTLYNLEQTTATVCYEYDRAHPTATCRSAVAMADFPEMYAQLLRSETFQFCDLSQPHVPPAIDPEPLILVCPIVDDQRVLGDIRLYRASDELFAEPEVRLVQQVANQCAIALRQARLHEAVQAQVHELEHLNQLKDDFLSTVSHELRSPMTNIKMAVQMLKTVLDANLATQAAHHTDVILSQTNFSKAVGYLQILSKECQRETNLINDLLDLAHLEAETTPDSLQEVVLQEWVPQVTESFRERIVQQHQELQIHVPVQLPPLSINLTALERILTELLHNACKYTPTGETITVSVTTCEEQAGATLPNPSPCLLLNVSNSGVEISESDRACIFDKFYRIPNGDPWKHGGTGLGLALVKRLVEQLSGSIEVSSCDNLVCFTLKLAC